MCVFNVYNQGPRAIRFDPMKTAESGLTFFFFFRSIKRNNFPKYRRRNKFGQDTPQMAGRCQRGFSEYFDSPTCVRLYVLGVFRTPGIEYGHTMY